MRVRPAAPILFLMLALSAPAAAEHNTPAATVHAFFADWSAGDEAAAAAHWIDPSSPDVHRHVRRVLATSCIELHEVRVAGIRVTGDRAEVDVELRLTKRNAMPGAPVRHEIAGALLRLQRSDSTWRIESWREREEQQIDELLRATAKDDWLDARATDWTPKLARALATRGVTHINRDEFDLAAELIALSTRMATALGDDAAMAVALAAASALERKKVQPDPAASTALARESLALAERSGDPDAIALALVRLGRSLSEGANVEMTNMERALALADVVEDQTIPAMAASHLAMGHEFRSDFRMALLHASIAERFGRAAGHDTTLLSVELNFGGLYDRLGDLELALLHYDRAAALARRNGFHRIYASFVNLIVSAHHRLGKSPAELVPMIDQALALPFVRETPEIVSDLYCTRATMQMELRDFEQAEADLLEAIAATDGRLAHLGLAELRFRQERYEDAKTAVEVTGLDWHGPYVYLAALRATGEIDKALAAALCANEWGDVMFGNILPRDRNRQLFLASQYGIDRITVDLLVRRGDHREALAAADAAKGRVLLEAATRARVQAPETDSERALKETVERLNRAVLAETDARRHDGLRADLNRARLELDEIRLRTATRTREQKQYTETSMTHLSEWPFTGLTALEYVVGDRDTIIFVARQGAGGRMRLDVRVVSVQHRELVRLIDQFRERIAARDLRYEETARRLYELLIAPVEPLIASAKTLCIIPDGELWKVPFQVLTSARGTALVERVPLFYAASIRMLHAVAREATTRRAPRLLALGNPSIGAMTAARYRAYERATTLGDLSDAENEVHRIADLYGRDRSAVHVRGEAREALFKEKAPQFDVLHVASHGLVDNAAPMFSALVLAAAHGDAEDGLLEAHEVAELQLNADLVVLSACETAAGKIGGGEGILGLSWAFLAAGTRGLVGSQWKAPSAATEILMVAFHERLLAGDSPAEALRRAQLRLMRDERYESPLDWAPFILVGNGLR